ncbi:MAG: hypothetical protein M3N19_09310, partial [Candidatus Eremiobacteraeota bacterium]|nr:hypothetical protein [Candidatus Eremiobacteraeota bacterium]
MTGGHFDPSADCSGATADSVNAVPPAIQPDNGQAGFTAANYQWGPNGHPIRLDYSTGAPFNPTSWHWDGGSLLYSVDNNGLTLFIGSEGAVRAPGNPSSQISVYDRDWTGSIAQGHTNTAYTDFENINPMHVRFRHASDATQSGGSSVSNYIPTLQPDLTATPMGSQRSKVCARMIPA